MSLAIVRSPIDTPLIIHFFTADNGRLEPLSRRDNTRQTILCGRFGNYSAMIIPKAALRMPNDVDVYRVMKSQKDLGVSASHSFAL